jgi:hypothetical protein
MIPHAKRLTMKSVFKLIPKAKNPKEVVSLNKFPVRNISGINPYRNANSVIW